MEKLNFFSLAMIGGVVLLSFFLLFYILAA